MRKRPLLSICLSYIAGILFSHYVIPGINLKPIFYLTALFLILFVLAKRGKRFLLILFTFFLIGIILDNIQHKESELLDFADGRPNVTIYGNISEVTAKSDTNMTFILAAKYLFEGGNWKPIQENVEIIVQKNPIELFPGQKVYLFGKLEPLRGFLTPGAYSSVRQKNIKMIFTRLKIKDGRYLIPFDEPGLYKKLLQVKKSFLDFMKKYLDGEPYQIGAAVLLGEKALVSYPLKDSFAKAGLSHILVVSGLHVGLLAGVSLLCLRWLFLRIPFWGQRLVPLSLGVALAAVIFYVVLTGFHVSGQRAMWMAVVFIFSIFIYRRADSFSTLSIAALLILFADPHYLFSLSFQLSFLAVVGIIWGNANLLKPLREYLRSKNNINVLLKKIIEYVVSITIVSISANIFLLPILIYNFNQISLIGIITNVICIPILGLLVVPFGMLSIVVYWFSEAIASYCFFPCYLGINSIYSITRLVSFHSYGFYYWFSPYIWEILLYYIVLLTSFFSNRQRKMLKHSMIGLFVLVLLHVVLGNYGIRHSNTMKVHFLDVGQGSCCVIALPNGKVLLIDAGGLPNTDYDVGRNVVAKFLWKNRIRSIDLAILTHPDYDHIGGFYFIAEAFKIKSFLTTEMEMPEDLRQRLKNNNVQFLDAYKNEKVDGDGYLIHIYHPKPETISICSDLNDTSLIFKFVNEFGSLMMTGDNGRQVLDRIAATYGTRLKADVLLLPHHGSKNSLSVSFYKDVAPEIAVASCGYRNPFGFPSKEVVDAINDLRIPIFSTKDCGTITLLFSKKETGTSNRITPSCFTKFAQK